VKNSIVGVLNTSILQIKKILKENNIKFDVYSKKLQHCDNHIIFSSLTSLVSAYERNIINKTPILLETATVLDHMALTENVVFVDSMIKPNGIIYFEKLRVEDMLNTLNETWDAIPGRHNLCIFRRAKTVQHGIDADLADTINLILNTFPTVVHESFMVALCNGFSDDFKYFNSYIKDNRLICIDNKKLFIKLNEMLMQLQPIMQKLIKNDKKTVTKMMKSLEPDVLDNFRRMRFYYNLYKNKDISLYLDSENNVKAD
jgi:hypothetical protein